MSLGVEVTRPINMLNESLGDSYSLIGGANLAHFNNSHFLLLDEPSKLAYK